MVRVMSPILPVEYDHDALSKQLELMATDFGYVLGGIERCAILADNLMLASLAYGNGSLSKGSSRRTKSPHASSLWKRAEAGNAVEVLEAHGMRLQLGITRQAIIRFQC